MVVPSEASHPCPKEVCPVPPLATVKVPEVSEMARFVICVMFVSVMLSSILASAIDVPLHTPVEIVPSVVRAVPPAQVERAVFSTRLRARVDLRLGVEVPARVPVPEAYKTSPAV